MSFALPFSVLVFVFFTGLILLEKASRSNSHLKLLPTRAHGATNFKSISPSDSLQMEGRVLTKWPSPAFGPTNDGRKDQLARANYFIS